MVDRYDSFDELWNRLKGRVPEIQLVESAGDSDLMKYRLNEVVTSPTTFYLQRTADSGRTKWGSVRLDPGKLYETDDPVFLQSLAVKGYVKVPYNEKLEQKLTELGKEFEVELCKSCGGRVKKIHYHAIEVL